MGSTPSLSANASLGLGSARLVSLADAREKAAQLRRDARAGKDPLAERERNRNLPTFKKAAKEVHASHATTFRNTKHKAQWISSLELYAFPLLGDRLVDLIDTADVLKVLAPIWTLTPETARRVKQRIKVVFDWAKASGFRSGDNPTDGLTKVLPKHRGEKQHHAALPYTAVPAFIQALRAADTSPSIRLALELLIVTATRTNEMLLATWPEVDLEAKVWKIPGTRMKAGREHRVPLSERAIELLKQAHVYAAGSPFVFPGRTGVRPLSNMVFLMLLRRLQRTDITVHGFRSSFRDWAAERTNVARAVCEAALAHAVQDKTEAAFSAATYSSSGDH